MRKKQTEKNTKKPTKKPAKISDTKDYYAGVKPYVSYEIYADRKKKKHAEKKKEMKKTFLEIYSRLGFVPNRREITECGIPSEVIRYYFGTYVNFLKEMGLKLQLKSSRNKITAEKNLKKEIISNKIKKLTKELERIPTLKEYEEKYGKVKGMGEKNFSKLLNLINPALIEKSLSKKQIEDIYIKYIKEKGIPFVYQLPKELPQAKVIRKYFKTFNAMLAEIGYDEQAVAFYKMSKEEMIDFLQKKVDRYILREPKDFRLNRSLPFWETVKFVLGCKGFKEMADIIDRQELLYRRRYLRYTRRDLTNLYKKLAVKLNKEDVGLTFRDFEIYHHINCYNITLLFGGINQLRTAAGYKPINEDSKVLFEKDDIAKALRRKSKILGRNLMMKEIIEDSELPSITSIYKIFGVEKIDDLHKVIRKN